MARGEESYKRLDSIIHWVGLAVPIVLIFHIILLDTGVLPADRFIYPTATYVLMAAWIATMLHLVLRPPKTNTGEITYVSAYHIFGAAYVLFVCGMNSQVVYLWALLPVAAYRYAGRHGYWASIATFSAVALADALMHASTITSLATSVMAYVGVVTLGSIMTLIAHELETERENIATEHTKEHLQRDRLTTVINNLADAIIATNARGIIDTYNAAALNLIDTNRPLTGLSVDTVLPLTTEQGDEVELAKLLQAAHKVEARDDLQLKLGDETLRLSLIFSPIKSTDSQTDQATHSYVIIMRDITREKSLEEERDEFVSVVSHELRTPITIAEGALSNVALMQERGIATPAQVQQGVAMAHEQVLFLSGMINDLSTLSRAERGIMADKAPIEVEPFIHNLYNEYTKEAHKKKLHLNLDLDPQLGTVQASELYLHELIQNFITNAIKYTKQGSITISVRKKAGELTFSVTDTGIGISKSDQKRVFEKFFRSEDYRTRETSGTGLGLYVAKKLSHLLGTTISLESRLNHGSTFSFSLPQVTAGD